MNDDVYNILIHTNLISQLRKKDIAFRSQFHRMLEKLQFGYWDNGTRVKVLKGVRKAVYEARINRGDRMLFTVIRAHHSEPPHALTPHILVWDVVTHDNIDRAQRMNIQPETGFLDFEEKVSLSIENTPVNPDVSVTDCHDAGALEYYLYNSSLTDPQNELTDTIRWYLLGEDIIFADSEWQKLLDDPTVEDFELKLSIQQFEALEKAGPVLLRGTAGSGKTTVNIYRLAQTVLASPESRILYVTYSESLLSSAKHLFEELFKARRLPLPDPAPEFLTFPQLYEKIAGSKKQHKLLRFPVFDNWYKTIYGKTDSALAWEEIRGIIKGACLDIKRPHLTYDEYVELGRKRAPLFAKERPWLYQVFERYKSWCESQKRMDDIDAARLALRHLQHSNQPLYETVICDEGQDLTELEMSLFIKLAEDVSGLFFAADPQQIVNPSGFRWAELRSLLRHITPNKMAPEICSLSKNYRSVNSIVTLANTFLEIQRNRTGRSDDDEAQETTLRGASPVLVGGDEGQVIEAISDFGPRCAVITGSFAEAERLRKVIGSERIFDISGSKGLEFDACILWNIFTPDTDIWQQLLCDDISLKEDPASRRAIHHAYVAVTRAKKYLGIYESSDAAFGLWQVHPLRGHLEDESPDALKYFMFPESNQNDWEKEGDFYIERKRYRQAAECFRRAGLPQRELECNALFEESVENYMAAAEIFKKLEMYKNAAVCFELEKRFQEAADLYFKVKEWEKAGDNYRKVKRYKHAAEAYQAAGKQQEYLECSLQDARKSHLWEKAATIAEKLDDSREALLLWRRAGRNDCVLRINLQHLEEDGKFLEGAKLLESNNDLKEAASWYQKAGITRKANLCEARWEESCGNFKEAADLYRQIDNLEKYNYLTGRILENDKDYRSAAEHYEQIDYYTDLVRALHKAGKEDWSQQWLHALKAERDDHDYIKAMQLYIEIAHFVRFDYLMEMANSTKSLSYDEDNANSQIYEINNMLPFYKSLSGENVVIPDVDYLPHGFSEKAYETAYQVYFANKSYNYAARVADCYLNDKERLAEIVEQVDDKDEFLLELLSEADRLNEYRFAAHICELHGDDSEADKYMGLYHQGRKEYKQALEYFEKCEMTELAAECKEKLAEKEKRKAKKEEGEEND